VDNRGVAATIVKCDCEKDKKSSNSSYFCTTPGFKAPVTEDYVGILYRSFFVRKLGGERISMIHLADFRQQRSVSLRQTVWYAARTLRDYAHQFHSICQYSLCRMRTWKIFSENLPYIFLRFCSRYFRGTWVL